MLKEISIYNFKCLHEAKHLSLGKVTLLTGVNGRGKSSFLQSLLVLSQTWRRSLYNVLIPSDPDLVTLGSYEDIHSVNHREEAMRMQLITDDAADNDFEVVYQRSDSRPDIGELVDFKVGGRSPLGNEETETEEETEDGLEMDAEELQEEDEMTEDDAERNPYDMSAPMLTSLQDHPSLMALKNIYYVAANRQPAGSSYSPKGGIGFFTLRPDGSNVLEAIYRLGPEKLRLKEMLKDIFGSANILVREADDKSIVLTMNSSDDKPEFTPANVGYGYSYILTMLTALLMMKEHDTLIIENPEAHLHPGAQAAVMRILIDEAVKRGLQIFVETHSDHIVNGALIGVRTREDFSKDDLSILFFGRDRVLNLEITPRGHILCPPKDFCDQYARDLDILYPFDEVAEWER